MINLVMLCMWNDDVVFYCIWNSIKIVKVEPFFSKNLSVNVLSPIDQSQFLTKSIVATAVAGDTIRE